MYRKLFNRGEDAEALRVLEAYLADALQLFGVRGTLFTYRKATADKNMKDSIPYRHSSSTGRNIATTVHDLTYSDASARKNPLCWFVCRMLTLLFGTRPATSSFLMFRCASRKGCISYAMPQMAWSLRRKRTTAMIKASVSTWCLPRMAECKRNSGRFKGITIKI